MDKKGFKIPRSTLAQLNEFSSGGFVLFSYDDNGDPCVHSQFDSNKDALAIQMFVLNWAEAMNEISQKSTQDSILGFGDDFMDEEDIFNPEDDDLEDLV